MLDNVAVRSRLPKMLTLVQWAVYTIALLTVMAIFLGSWWPFEYACHFRVQYSAILLIGMGCGLMRRRPLLGLIAAVFLAVNLAVVLPFFTGRRTTGVDSPIIRLFSANVAARNRHPNRLIDIVRDTDADLVLLYETNQRWKEVVDEIADNYPYEVREMASGNFSFVVLSRFPLESTERKRFGRISIYGLVMAIDVDGQPLRLIASHLLPPFIPSYQRQRNEQLFDLADEAALSSDPTIWVGDLNITPWSPKFKTAVRRSGLRDGRLGFGTLATWPAFLPGARIPIDHCLVSPHVTLTRLARGPGVGGDHLPLIVEFAIESGGNR